MTITAPYNTDTLNGLYAVLQTAGKKDDPEILNAVQVSESTFIATDRFRVGEWRHSPETTSDKEAAPITVPRAAIEWLLKQTPNAIGMQGVADNTGPESALKIQFTESSISIQWGESGEVVTSMKFTALGGKFPPIARLLLDRTPEPVAFPALMLGAAHLEGFIRGGKKVMGATAEIKFTPTPSTRPNKPGPVFIEFPGHPFRGLIQPRLLLQ